LKVLASVAEPQRHPADAALVAVVAPRAVVAAWPRRDWVAMTDAPAAGRPGRCAARDWPPDLMPFLAADKVARRAADPDAAPASPSGMSAAANSWGHRAAARPVAVAGPVREPADGRDHRRRAVDWL